MTIRLIKERIGYRKVSRTSEQRCELCAQVATGVYRLVCQKETICVAPLGCCTQFSPRPEDMAVVSYRVTPKKVPVHVPTEVDVFIEQEFKRIKERFPFVRFDRFKELLTGYEPKVSAGPQEPEVLFTITEAVAYSGIDRVTLWRYVRAGLLVPVSIPEEPRHPRYRKSDMDSLLLEASCRVKLRRRLRWGQRMGRLTESTTCPDKGAP